MVAKAGQSVRQIVLLLIAAVAFIAMPSSARAQGIGFNGGATVDPAQGYFGTYVETKEIAHGLYLRPGVDIGFGNRLTIASIYFEVLYKYPIGSAWKIYQGGGPVVYVIRQGEPAEHQVTGGLAGVFGFEHESGFFVEFKGGSGRGPSLKFGAGFTIH